MFILLALASGLVFGFGLIAAGMNDPAKVLGFLDVAGAWDPSLALVMGGAVGVATLAFAWVRKHPGSLFGGTVQLPRGRPIDCPLILGSALFGVGWGLSGFCPGPGLLSLGAGYPPAIAFVAAMALGMKACDWWLDKAKAAAGAP